MVAIFLPVFMAAALYNLVQMIRMPTERKRRGIRLAIWFAALLLVGAVQSHWTTASRRDADAAVQAILAHKARTGAYPTRLDELGLDEQALAEKWRLKYSVRDGKAALAYPMTLMPLSIYEYDFDAGRWRENSY